MPNWVTNHVNVRGDYGDFFKRAKMAEESGLFNEFVPRPKCYEYDTTNYHTGDRKFGNLLKVGTKLGWGDNAFTVDENYIEQFKKAEKEQKKHGAIGWYEWDIKNWGTKWDACDLSVCDDDNVGDMLDFQTAWSYPDKFFKSVSKLYPKARFYVMYADEDIGQNCGGVVWCNGKSIDIDAATLFAEMLWDGDTGFTRHINW